MVVLVVFMLAVSLWNPPEATWDWPVDARPQVLRDFEAPESPWGPGHRGLDLAARPGSDVVAPVSGAVHFSGDVAGRGVITIRTSDGHLVSLEPVQVDDIGSRVRKGQVIGELAAGHCRSGCVHIGLRVDGAYRSPARELGILRRATLF